MDPTLNRREAAAPTAARPSMQQAATRIIPPLTLTTVGSTHAASQLDESRRDMLQQQPNQNQMIIAAPPPKDEQPSHSILQASFSIDLTLSLLEGQYMTPDRDPKQKREYSALLREHESAARSRFDRSRYESGHIGIHLLQTPNPERSGCITEEEKNAYDRWTDSSTPLGAAKWLPPGCSWKIIYTPSGGEMRTGVTLPPSLKVASRFYRPNEFNKLHLLIRRWLCTISVLYLRAKHSNLPKLLVSMRFTDRVPKEFKHLIEVQHLMTIERQARQRIGSRAGPMYNQHAIYDLHQLLEIADCHELAARVTKRTMLHSIQAQLMRAVGPAIKRDAPPVLFEFADEDSLTALWAKLCPQPVDASATLPAPTLVETMKLIEVYHDKLRANNSFGIDQAQAVTGAELKQTEKALYESECKQYFSFERGHWFAHPYLDKIVHAESLYMQHGLEAFVRESQFSGPVHFVESFSGMNAADFQWFVYEHGQRIGPLGKSSAVDKYGLTKDAAKLLLNAPVSFLATWHNYVQHHMKRKDSSHRLSNVEITRDMIRSASSNAKRHETIERNKRKKMAAKASAVSSDRRYALAVAAMNATSMGNYDDEVDQLGDPPQPQPAVAAAAAAASSSAAPIAAGYPYASRFEPSGAQMHQRPAPALFPPAAAQPLSWSNAQPQPQRAANAPWHAQSSLFGSQRTSALDWIANLSDVVPQAEPKSVYTTQQRSLTEAPAGAAAVPSAGAPESAPAANAHQSSSSSSQSKPVDMRSTPGPPSTSATDSDGHQPVSPICDRACQICGGTVDDDDFPLDDLFFGCDVRRPSALHVQSWQHAACWERLVIQLEQRKQLPPVVIAQLRAEDRYTKFRLLRPCDLHTPDLSLGLTSDDSIDPHAWNYFSCVVEDFVALPRSGIILDAIPTIPHRVLLYFATSRNDYVDDILEHICEWETRAKAHAQLGLLALSMADAQKMAGVCTRMCEMAAELNESTLPLNGDSGDRNLVSPMSPAEVESNQSSSSRTDESEVATNEFSTMHAPSSAVSGDAGTGSMDETMVQESDPDAAAAQPGGAGTKRQSDGESLPQADDKLPPFKRPRVDTDVTASGNAATISNDEYNFLFDGGNPDATNAPVDNSPPAPNSSSAQPGSTAAPARGASPSQPMACDTLPQQPTGVKQENAASATAGSSAQRPRQPLPKTRTACKCNFERGTTGQPKVICGGAVAETGRTAGQCTCARENYICDANRCHKPTTKRDTAALCCKILRPGVTEATVAQPDAINLALQPQPAAPIPPVVHQPPAVGVPMITNPSPAVIPQGRRGVDLSSTAA